jgi:TolB protein
MPPSLTNSRTYGFALACCLTIASCTTLHAEDSEHTLKFKVIGPKSTARVSIQTPDGKYVSPQGVIDRTTARGEDYFYVDGSFSIDLTDFPVRLTIAGGIEYVPRTYLITAAAESEKELRLESWIEMSKRGWFSGDSHIHLHTGGPLRVSQIDALLAARAEGLNFVNLCVSNNLGDDIRDAEFISGRPDNISDAQHLIVFGEEMRSSIYGHMQFFGINKLVEPQYTGFDNTPNSLDFPANYTMAKDACDQGGLVTYGHPMLKGAPEAFGPDPTAANGAARELPIDAALGVVHAMDVMSYNSDETLSSGLWYRLLNCGFRISACVGTDALLDQSTDPMGGSRVYARTAGPFSMATWLDALKHGRTFVTNGPMPALTVNKMEPGETCRLDSPAEVEVSAKVESLVAIETIEVLVNGVVVKSLDIKPTLADIQHHEMHFKLPITKSCWIALRVRGADDKRVFDGPAWAHTSPVYVTVDGQPISSPEDAKYFVEWNEKLLRVVATRNRYATPTDRAEVEALFRKGQDYFRKMASQ